MNNTNLDLKWSGMNKYMNFIMIQEIIIFLYDEVKDV